MTKDSVPLSLYGEFNHKVETDFKNHPAVKALYETMAIIKEAALETCVPIYSKARTIVVSQQPRTYEGIPTFEVEMFIQRKHHRADEPLANSDKIQEKSIYISPGAWDALCFNFHQKGIFLISGFTTDKHTLIGNLPLEIDPKTWLNHLNLFLQTNLHPDQYSAIRDHLAKKGKIEDITKTAPVAWPKPQNHTPNN